MTALKEYERLEAPGLWRASQDAQRRDVIVSLGEATLTITDMADRALAHWSLPAVIRRNPGQTPALFAPGPDSDEELELDEPAMIAALEKLHAVIERRRPHKGRLRHLLTGGLFAGLAALAVFWLPGALVSYTAGVVPEATRTELGKRLATNIHRVAGKVCREPRGVAALARFGRALLGDEAPMLEVLSDLSRPALHLPGQVIVLSRAVIEDSDSPFAAAGFILAEDEYARRHDPMLALLESAGLFATLRLLTTGAMSDATLDRFAEQLLLRDHAPLPAPELLARFAAAGQPASPYAYALDPSGETTLALIEADPVPLDQATPPLSDGDWISLQGICAD